MKNNVLYPYSIEIKFSNFNEAVKRSKKAKNWCQKNCVGFSYFNKITDVKNPVAKWFFQKYEDVVFFKLVWGEADNEIFEQDGGITRIVQDQK